MPRDNTMTEAGKERVREREDSRVLASSAEELAREAEGHTTSDAAGSNAAAICRAVRGLTLAVLSVAAAVRGMDR